MTSLTLERIFAQRYDREPEWIARAPGRVNLIGEHTDYNGGFVLPMAIERHTEIAAAASGSQWVTLRSTAFDDAVRIDINRPIEPTEQGHWSNYAKGVIAGFLAAGFSLPGLDVLIHSSVPLGGGLSSSAALEVALATLLEAVVGMRLGPKRKATLCREAEHRYAHVPCGIMDQLVSTLARENHVLLIDCRSEEVEYIDLPDPSVAVLIINTNVKHQLAGSEYAIRRAQCERAAQRVGVSLLREAVHDRLSVFRESGRFPSAEDEVLYRRAQHVLGEHDRTYAAACAIRQRDWLQVGALMYASHESLRNNFEVSCAELDVLVEIAQSIGPKGGLFGCRMTGGGFGGCAVALIQTEHRATISRTITHEYQARTGIDPTLFVSRPAAGARLIEPSI